MGLNNTIEEIKAKGNIIDIVAAHVQLKRTGANYKGCCPFHNEKTPSFVVSEDKQIFTCFGCGASGDMIKFVQMIDNLEFPEAVEKLAEKFGVQIDSSGFNAEKNKNKYYDINREAAMFFYNSIQDAKTLGAVYMKGRGLTPATMKKFGIGYAPDSWDSVLKHLNEKEISEKDMIDLGLISKNASGKKFDKFRNRVIFPIINTRGKVIGFGGRALSDEDNPKYLNSPETVVFSKKNNLYGLNLTRQEINKRNAAILVEGYMDVISLYQYGVKNVAASLGTALTANQAAMIKRYADNVIISYDSDAAGEAAALRAIDILYAAGCNIKVVQVTGAKDPDEFVKKHGAEAFYKLTDEAPTFVEFKVKVAKRKYDMSTTSGSVDFLKEVATILKGLKSPIEADVYIEKIAMDTHISAGAIRSEIYGDMNPLGRSTREPSKATGPMQSQDGRAVPTGKKTKRNRAGDFLEKSLIKLMLIKAEFVPRIENKNEVFQNPIYMRMYDIITSLYTDDSEIDIGKLKDTLSDHENMELNHILENVLISENEENFFNDCMNKIQNEKLKVREKEILDILTILDEEGNVDQIKQLNQELMEMRSKRYGI